MNVDLGIPSALLFRISQAQGCILFDSCFADWAGTDYGPKDDTELRHAPPPKPLVPSVCLPLGTI